MHVVIPCTRQVHVVATAQVSRNGLAGSVQEVHGLVVRGGQFQTALADDVLGDAQYIRRRRSTGRGRSS